jgi:hypothetical protein
MTDSSIYDIDKIHPHFRYCQKFYEKAPWNIRKDKGNPPPCGGREKAGGEKPDGRSKKTQETLYGYQVFSNLEGVLEDIINAILTPHPNPLPPAYRQAGKGRGEIIFENTTCY